MSFERGDHHARLLRWHSVCVEVYASYFQQELGDVAKEWVGDVSSPVRLCRLRVLPKVTLQYFRGEDVEMVFPGAIETQLSTHHGVCERVDVKLARHLQHVRVRGRFNHQNEIL